MTEGPTPDRGFSAQIPPEPFASQMKGPRMTPGADNQSATPPGADSTPIWQIIRDEPLIPAAGIGGSTPKGGRLKTALTWMMGHASPVAESKTTPSDEVYNQIADALPFVHEVPPVFSDADIDASRSKLQRMGENGVAAGYEDYYGRTFFRFDSDDRPPSPLPDGLIAIPRSRWGEWKVVQSGADIYAEPATTEHLEPAAVSHPADSIIDDMHTRLNRDDLSRGEVVQTLLMLGQLPFSAPTVRGRVVPDEDIEGLDIDASVIEEHTEQDDPHIIVHTPREGIRLGKYLGEKNKYKLFAAQADGQIESTRFNPEGSYLPAGKTGALDYGRGSRDAIPRVQVKWLRRNLVNRNLPGNQ